MISCNGIGGQNTIRNYLLEGSEFFLMEPLKLLFPKGHTMDQFSFEIFISFLIITEIQNFSNKF